MGINQDSLLIAYDASHTRFSSFTQKIGVLIKAILNAKAVKTHVITARMKDRESFQKKISKPGKTYNTLNDVKDICGVRIITYFEDEVDPIAEIIEREFIVDFDNSVDKRRVLNTDAFGYLSLHYVCSLLNERACLSEYNEFAEIPFEVQIRSVLQHAWAEIEHDLGYKSEVAIPKEIRRKFARVAGALEGADEDFNEIKQYLHHYELSIGKDIATDANLVSIDKVSLNYFLKESTIVKELDSAIAKKIDVGIRSSENEHPQYIDARIQELRHIKVFTISDLEVQLNENSEEIVNFIETYIESHSVFGMNRKDFKDIPRGWSVMFLPFVKILGSTLPGVTRLHNLKEYFFEVEQPHRNYDKDMGDRVATERSKIMFDHYNQNNH